MKSKALTPWLVLIAMLSAVATAQERPADVEVRTLVDGVWLHTSYRTLEDGTRFPSHGLIVREGETLTLIDTAWGEKETGLLLDAIAVQVGLPVTRAVVTHFHGDRAEGSDVLEAEGVEVWAHPMTHELSIERGNPVPDLVFDGLDEPGDAIAFGGLEIFYPGPAHSRDNIMVWLPESSLLFGGCAIRGAADQELGNVRDGDVSHWGTAMALTQARYGGAEIVVSSHAEPGGAELIAHTAEVVKAEQERARRNPVFESFGSGPRP
jgi:metallo-beta-lactamase class B VIM